MTMKNIIPHLWFDNQAKEATAFYASLFKDSHVTHVSTISNTPSGDCDIVSFNLSQQDFMAISAGPIFTFNPSISFFAVFDTEADIKKVWNALIDGGKALMSYDTYPWAQKYGWVQDKYGLSWQLSMSKDQKPQQPITPLCMFTGAVAGKAKEAIDMYTSVFPNSSLDMAVTYTTDDADTEGFIKHARFTLNGKQFMAMDSFYPHGFTFNEAISFIIQCDTQEEIDHYWKALSAVPEAEHCGWLKDKYGISWQVVPTIMNTMMSSGDSKKTTRVTKAFMAMKKFDIDALQKAYEE